ncbi:MAG: N-acetylmuramoyl-L-alanine amidase [Flavobacteriales bacterium]
MEDHTKLSKLYWVSSRTLILFFGITFLIHGKGYSQTQGVKAKINTVVIDAGHGGKDPGCHGGFAHEKEVCLSMALKLGKRIKEHYPHINVVYTRQTDVFVELIERANIANKANADLFICIHANSGASSAYGTETYVLGLHRTESQQKVMERENAIVSLEEDKGAKYKAFDLTADAMIAIQLQQNVNLNNAIKFAQFLQKEFKAIGRSDRGVKQAGFLVLYKTAMPSVLIETGFLTNPNEERFLGNIQGQDQMAKAMFEAFVSYKAQYEGKTISSPAPPPNPPKEPVAPDPKPIVPKEVGSGPGPANEVFFTIQILSSDSKVSLSSPKFKGLKVYEYRQDNVYKYYTGIFVKDLPGAKKYREEMVEKGFSSAFVIAFSGQERISIEKAIKLAEK